jgi:tetratricopeptide (TPR) repeat protein
MAQPLNLLPKLNFEQAETLWMQSLAIRERTFDPEHPVTAERLNDLAELYFAQGCYTEARSLCQRALRLCEKRPGPEHPDTIAYRRHLTRIVDKRETRVRWSKK